MNGLLLHCPAKYDDESIEGYVIKLAIANFVDQKYLLNKRFKRMSSEENILENFHYLRKITGYLFDQEHLLHQWTIDGLTIPVRYVHRAYVQLAEFVGKCVDKYYS